MRWFQFRSVFAKLFVSVLAALVLFAIAMLLLNQSVQNNSASLRTRAVASQLVSQVEPFLQKAQASDSPIKAQIMLAVVKKTFEIFDDSLDAKIGLYSADGYLVFKTDDTDLPAKLPQEPSWLMSNFPILFGTTPPIQAQITSRTGYTILYEPRHPPHRSTLSAVLNLFTGTLLLLMLMAAVLWWIARSMTWRINQLSQQMAQLGEGDFTARVGVHGNDEIASLAMGFNQAAQKIEKLVSANNLLLAHASHELRTPITRIRLQVEMMNILAQELSDDNKRKFDKRATAINRDLSGLNQLVESILLVSRLDAGHALQQVEQLDLHTLVQQESQHYPEAHLYGESMVIDGQPQLLTHLIRNLLNNAMIHGIPPVQVYVYGVENMQQVEFIPARLVIDKAMTDEHDVDIDTNNPAIEPAQNDDGDKDNRHDNSNDNNTANDNNNSNVDAPLNITNAHSKEEPANETHQQPHHTKLPNKKTNKKSARTTMSDTAQKAQETLAKMRQKPMPTVTYRHAVLAVIDQGNGVPVDKREDIFSPFVRLKQEKKGSGLGLSLVSQIVEAHRGHIITDTWQGHTRFLVVLPIKSK